MDHGIRILVPVMFSCGRDKVISRAVVSRKSSRSQWSVMPQYSASSGNLDVNRTPRRVSD